jgi:hypothetical protein
VSYKRKEKKFGTFSRTMRMNFSFDNREKKRRNMKKKTEIDKHLYAFFPFLFFALFYTRTTKIEKLSYRRAMMLNFFCVLISAELYKKKR